MLHDSASMFALELVTLVETHHVALSYFSFSILFSHCVCSFLACMQHMATRLYIGGGLLQTARLQHASLVTCRCFMTGSVMFWLVFMCAFWVHAVLS